MPIDSTHLLTMLEPAVRPAAAPTVRREADGATRAAPFRDMLAIYAHETRPMPPGTRRVTVAAARLTEPLDEEALSRLAAAADEAERAGASRAIMIYDGRGLVMDVGARAIELELEPAHSAPLTDIDAAVYVSAAGEAPVEPSLRLPEAGVLPPSIVEQIEAAHALRAGNREDQDERDAHRHVAPR